MLTLLQPENILLSNDNDAGPIKITDFGLSKFYSEEMMSTACGSPGYIGWLSFDLLLTLST